MARGMVVVIRDRLGGRIPYFSTGIDCFNRGYLLARAAKKRHHDDTKANCIKVSVKGFGSAVRMALEEVFVKMEAMYHMPQSIYTRQFSALVHTQYLATYDKPWRQRHLECICDFVHILADACLPGPYCPECLTQTLLPPMRILGGGRGMR
jgi:hypothetical protein